MGIANLFRKKEQIMPPTPPASEAPELPSLSPMDELPTLGPFELSELPKIEEPIGLSEQSGMKPASALPPQPEFRPFPRPIPEFKPAARAAPEFKPFPKPEFRPAPKPFIPKFEPIPRQIPEFKPAPKPIPEFRPFPKPAPKPFVPQFRPAPKPISEFKPAQKILPPKQDISQKPFFVKVDDYRSILEGATLIRNNLKEADEIIGRLNELKNEGDKEFEKWRTRLEDAQRKLAYVDKLLFEAG